MRLKDLCNFLDSAIPLSFQEGYDNAGLQVGLPEKEINSALITLDVTEEVLDEAGHAGCDVIISHHPLIFNGIKRLSGKTQAEKILLKAIRQDVAVYSAHTNLDALDNGVSKKMALKMKLNNVKVLAPLKNRLMKLVTYIPDNHVDKVRDALFNAGAGVIGNYDRCGFTTGGTGSYRAGENTVPFAGEKGKEHFEKEIRFETVLFSHSVIRALLDSHPYEEVAYDLYNLENHNIEFGMGSVGELPEAMEEMDFLKLLSEKFSASGVRYSKPTGKKITKVAMCGGAGSYLLYDAMSAGADAFVTADVRYHTFFDPGDKLLLADIGHFESEKFSTEILYDLIIKKFPTFAVRFSEKNTNPINYL
jgi:dinuclear metal center YbgI/SA1388 family protein